MSKILLSLLLCCFSTSCILSPVLNAVHQTGALQSDRQNLLSEALKSLNEEVYWGSVQKALNYVAAPLQVEYAKELSRRKKDEKVVETKIDSIEFSPNAFAADVEIRTRYYRVPMYIVLDRNETQHWEFSLATGWKMTSHKEKD